MVDIVYRVQYFQTVQSKLWHRSVQGMNFSIADEAMVYRLQQISCTVDTVHVVIARKWNVVDSSAAHLMASKAFIIFFQFESLRLCDLQQILLTYGLEERSCIFPLSILNFEDTWIGFITTRSARWDGIFVTKGGLNQFLF